jgi:hypothetical protein
VYIFDVVSEEQPLPTETTTERTARLARSEQRAPLAYRVSPWKRVVSDVLYLFSHLGSIPSMFVPCRRHAPGEKCHGHLNTATLTQAGLLLASCVVTLLGIGSLLACMPTVAALLLLVLLSEFVQGPTTRESKRPDVVPVPGSEREAWFL